MSIKHTTLITKTTNFDIYPKSVSYVNNLIIIHSQYPDTEKSYIHYSNDGKNWKGTLLNFTGVFTYNPDRKRYEIICLIDVYASIDLEYWILDTKSYPIEKNSTLISKWKVIHERSIICEKYCDQLFGITYYKYYGELDNVESLRWKSICRTRNIDGSPKNNYIIVGDSKVLSKNDDETLYSNMAISVDLKTWKYMSIGNKRTNFTNIIWLNGFYIAYHSALNSSIYYSTDEFETWHELKLRFPCKCSISSIMYGKINGENKYIIYGSMDEKQPDNMWVCSNPRLNMMSKSPSFTIGKCLPTTGCDCVMYTSELNLNWEYVQLQNLRKCNMLCIDNDIMLIGHQFISKLYIGTDVVSEICTENKELKQKLDIYRKIFGDKVSNE